MLAAGRFDLVLLEQQVGLHLLSREPALQKSLAWQGQTLARIPLFVGFAPPKPGRPDWAGVYAQGLSALFANGEYLRILQRHSQAIPWSGFARSRQTCKMPRLPGHKDPPCTTKLFG